MAGALRTDYRVTTVVDKMLDVSASYPHGELCFNISKETTSKEYLAIEGIDDAVAFKENMLICTGHVDAVEWCTNMLGFPKLKDLLTHYDRNHETNDHR